MSERGVFAVDRGVFDHPLFAREAFTEREAWIWLVGAAAWRAHRVRVSGKWFDLTRGQCAFSLRFLAEKWCWSKSRVGRFLERLENEDMIGTLSGTAATVITVCKYDEYQRVALPDRDTHESETGTGAGQERDKEEDIKNIQYPEANASGATQPALRAAARAKARGTRLPAGWGPDEEGQQFAVEVLGSLDEARREFAKFRDHWNAQPGAKGVKTDWPATWRNWCRKAVEIRGNRGPPRGSNTMSFHQIAEMIRNQPNETPADPGFEATTEPGRFDFGEPAGTAIRR